MNTVDFAPLFNNVVLPLLGVAVSVLAAWLAPKVAGWLNLQNQEVLRTQLENGLTNALALGLAKVAGRPLTVEVKNELLAEAMRYAVATVPERLKQFGILDPDQLRERLLARLERRLQSTTNEAKPS